MSTLQQNRREQLTLYSTAWLLAAVLALPLVACPTFAFDWVNHLWFANYVAQHLASDGILPMFVNTPNAVGNPILLFYGSGLYGTLAPLVLLFGPDIGMRTAVFFAFLAPTLVLGRFVHRCLGSWWAAGCATIVLSTSVYQLTNIYTRGATTEFFAYQFLLFGLVSVLDAILDQRASIKSAKIVLGLTSALIGTLSHPPTAYLAALFLSAPALAFVVIQRSTILLCAPRLARWTVALFILALPVLAWAYITFTHSPGLALNRFEANHHLQFFPNSIDHFLARLLPWPTDFRVEIEGFNFVSTPYLSAPINLGALVLLMAIPVGSLREGIDRPSVSPRAVILFRTLVLSAALLSLAASLPIGALERSIGYDGREIIGVVHADPSSWRGMILGRVQFAYRLVNLTNLTLVFGCLTVMFLQARYHSNVETFTRAPHQTRWGLLIAAAVVCALTASMKVVDVLKEFSILPNYTDRLLVSADTTILSAGIQSWVLPHSVEQMRAAVNNISEVPITQYGLAAYMMPTSLPAYKDDEGRVIKSVQFFRIDMSVQAVTTSCEAPCALMTDLIASPFLSISVNGFGLPRESLRSHHGLIVVLATEGAHRLEVSLGTYATSLVARSMLALILVFFLALLFLPFHMTTHFFRVFRRHTVRIDSR